MFPITVTFLGGKNLATTDITTATNQSTVGWSGITQVAITQSTPSGSTPSNLFHVVSFDNQITWKVFKSGTWTAVARNNGGTWQYSNNGSWTNASSNTQAQALVQATDQSIYQWQKAEVEALTSNNWSASGGLLSGAYLHWATRPINGWTIIADGTQNTSDAYATNVMTSNSSGGHVASATSENSNYYRAWCAFNQIGIDNYYWWGTTGVPTPSYPQSIMIDLGASNAKVLNKYKWLCGGSFLGSPCDWKFQGTNNTSASVGDAETANDWTTLHQVANGSSWHYINAWYTAAFTNSTAYRYYRFRVTGVAPAGTYLFIAELKLIEAQTTTIIPTFTKIAVQYES